MAEAFIVSMDFGQRLCAHLGLRSEDVRRLVITVEPGDLVTVEVTTLADEILGEIVLYEIQKYQLERVAE